MAIDPITAKIVSKIALDAVTDEKKRKTIIIIILAPIIGFLLLIALIIYIITSPLSMFVGLFIDDDLSAIEDLQKDYGYNQSIGIYEDDYIEGSGQNYECIIFTDGATEVFYYNQLDKRWAEERYGTDKIGTHGCGPTAMSIIVSSLTKNSIDPVTMSKWSVDNY